MTTTDEETLCAGETSWVVLNAQADAFRMASPGGASTPLASPASTPLGPLAKSKQIMFSIPFAVETDQVGSAPVATVAAVVTAGTVVNAGAHAARRPGRSRPMRGRGVRKRVGPDGSEQWARRGVMWCASGSYKDELQLQLF